ncbi:hypothetical protein GW17_00013430 [Ensete ventricosum]|nr:hypothetical protein GW17_00013430 [Ensete ventricosum]RZR93387.1 hypothetical protein BHM03_00021877 [Ensete ventricosum]
MLPLRFPNTFIEGLKPEIRGEVKARQPYTLTVVISFAWLQEEQFNQDIRRIRTTPRLAAYKSPPSFTSSYPLQPKKLTREELRDRSVKGLCWHCDESWSRDHYCKKGRLLLIKPIDDSEHEKEDHEHEEENIEDDPQRTDCMVHALMGYANPQMMKIGGFLKQQPIIILIEIGSTNNFMNNKVATQMALLSR